MQLTEGAVEDLWEAVGGREVVVRRKLDALRRQADKLQRLGRPDERLETWLTRYGD